MSNIRDLGMQSLTRFVGVLPKNPRRVIESELAFWESELFPVLDMQGVSRYRFVCNEILHKVGYVNVTPDRLADVVRRVRNKQKVLVEHVPSTPIQAVQTVPARTAKQVNMANAEDSLAALATPALVNRQLAANMKNEPDWDYKVERARLDQEGSHAAWTDMDEKIYTYIKQLSANSFIDMRTEFWKLDQHFISSTAKAVANKVYAKRTALGLPL